VPNRLAGVLLFLPVPLVLFLFTRAPLGILASLGVGIALMLTHRLYARPWALSRARQRCLWCGADVAGATPGPELVIEDPLGRSGWRACRDAHVRAVRALLAWAQRRGGFLKLGILGTLGVFLAWGLAAGLGWLSRAAFNDAVAIFHLGIAVSVLPLGWLAVRSEPAEGAEVVRSPFPVHLSALVGLRVAVWLFRLIGLLWLAQGALHLAERGAQVGVDRSLSRTSGERGGGRVGPSCYFP
jgi:hypothetical protein